MQYYPVFDAMQTHDLVLNIHGETPDIAVLDAEAAFMPQLHKIHAAFPALRIVLEHVSTREGLEAVRQCGATVRKYSCNPYEQGLIDALGKRDYHRSSSLGDDRGGGARHL